MPVRIFVSEKDCYRCRQTKPIEAFPKNRSKPTGAADECRECRRKLNAARYRKEEPASPGDSWARVTARNSARRKAIKT